MADEIRDRIAAALATMREGWGEGFANPHGSPARPAWVTSFGPSVRVRRTKTAATVAAGRPAAIKAAAVKIAAKQKAAAKAALGVSITE
jgi:hypothetical protein